MISPPPGGRLSEEIRTMVDIFEVPKWGKMEIMGNQKT